MCAPFITLYPYDFCLRYLLIKSVMGKERDALSRVSRWMRWNAVGRVKPFTSPVFKPYLLPFAATWQWASDFTFLGISHPGYKIGVLVLSWDCQNN